MRIGIDIRVLMHPERTGVGAYTFELLDALFREQTAHTYVLFYNSYKDVDDVVRLWDLPHVSYVRTAMPNKLFSLLQASTVGTPIDKLLAKKGHPVDLFFSPNLGFTYISSSVPHILTIHDLSFEINRDWFSKKRRLWHSIIRPQKQCQRASAILVPSHQTKEDLMDIYGISQQKIHIIPHGVAAAFLDAAKDLAVVERYGLPNKYFFFLGTIEPRKNIEGIIKAFTSLRLGRDGYELVIAGAAGWNNEALFSMIEAYEGVRYIGYVPDEDLPALFAGATAFVYPSLYEGFGLPVLEAMAVGVPVITSNRTSLPEITAGAAILVDPNNIRELARAMRDIVRRKTLQSQLIEAGEKRAQQYQWEKSARAFHSVCSHYGS